MENDYQILGIPIGASREEIKKAYRKIAHKFHPDKNQNPSASETFKIATRAYDSLLNTIQDDSNKAQSKYNRKGPDIRISISVTLYDIARCAKKSITTVRVGKCQQCNGTGSAQKKVKTCSFCGGNGFQGMPLVMGQKKDCLLCSGAGKIPEGEKCTICSGSGLIKETINREILLSPLSERILIYGSGNYCPRGEAGNLIIEVHTESHPIYSFQGLNIIGSINLSPVQAILGGPINIDVLGNKEEIFIQPGIQNGQNIEKIDGGLKFGDRKGRLKMKARIITPIVITSEEKELYEKILKIEKETSVCLKTWKL